MTATDIRKQNNDKGFSLVELIIVVSILAIAAIPLMRSMAMATRVNAKAQSMQNATSLAESIMEEIKSSSIEELKEKYGPVEEGGTGEFSDHGSYYEIVFEDVTATQGEAFKATVTIDKEEYKSGDESSEAQKVLAANKIKLPVIEEIDTNSQAVFTSLRDFNKYDTAAQSFFDEKNAKYVKTDPSTFSEISTKEVIITKSNAVSLGGYDGVEVKAIVKYTDTSGKEYIRDLYTGNFVAERNAENKIVLDSNIYIFYKVGKKRTVSDGGVVSSVALRETIKIEDNSSPPVENNEDSHRVYFIRQDISDHDGPKEISISGTASGSGGTFKYDDITPIPDPTPEDALPAGWREFGNVKLITNLESNLSNDGHIYKEESKNRVYSIKVVLTKDDDSTKYAELNSTVNANDAQ